MSNQLTRLTALDLEACHTTAADPRQVRPAHSLRSAVFLLQKGILQIERLADAAYTHTKVAYLSSKNCILVRPLAGFILQFCRQQCHIEGASCRSLGLSDTSPELLFLAGPNLQKLLIAELTQPGDYLSHFTSLTALTQLTLVNVVNHGLADFRLLRQLRLLELHMHNCSGVAEALFAPGSLPALQAFEFDEFVDFTMPYEQESSLQDELSAEAAEAQELGRAVFGHPSLLRLAGESRLSYLDMPADWVRQTELLAERVSRH